MDLFAGMNKAWVFENLPILILGTFVALQWIALQALVIHYYLFRKNLVIPRSDGVRFHLIEKAIALQHDQIQSIFAKLNEIRKDLASEKNPLGRVELANSSLESSFSSLGELQMKKRLQQLRDFSDESPKNNLQ